MTRLPGLICWKKGAGRDRLFIGLSPQRVKALSIMKCMTTIQLPAKSCRLRTSSWPRKSMPLPSTLPPRLTALRHSPRKRSPSLNVLELILWLPTNTKQLSLPRDTWTRSRQLRQSTASLQSTARRMTTCRRRMNHPPRKIQAKYPWEKAL